MICALPVLASVKVWFEATPSTTLPKASALGVTTRCDWMAIPVSATCSGSVDAEVAMESIPVRVPLIFGVKTTSTVQLELAVSNPPAAGQLPPAT